MNYSELSSLWKTDNGFWAFIVRREPRFDIIVVVKDGFGRPIQGVQFVLDNDINSTKVTGSDGIAQFSNLSLGNYTLSYDWRFQSGKAGIALTDDKKAEFSLYLSDETLLLFGVIIIVIVVATVMSARRRR